MAILVPTDQPTLQDAFDQLGPGVSDQIVVESGYTIEAALLLVGGDWSRVTVTSEDAEVKVGSAFPGGTLWTFRRCAGPAIELLVDAGGFGEDAVAVEETATLSVKAGCGVRRAGRSGLAARSGAVVHAEGAVFTEASHGQLMGAGITAIGGHIHAADADVSDSNYYGAQAGHGGVLSFRGGIADRAARYGIRATNGGHIDARDASADDCGKDGLRCFGASVVNARGLSARNAGDYGIVAHSSTVSAREAIVSGSRIGLRAARASKVDFSGGSAVGCTETGLSAGRVSEIDADGATVTDTGTTAAHHGAYASDGSTINLMSASVTGSGGNDLRIFQGAFITARDCTTSSGSPALADTNASAFNAIMSSFGIIWD